MSDSTAQAGQGGAAGVPAIPEVTDRDVLVTRAFDAPRDLVWRFFMDPALLSQWFGPRGVHVDPSTVNVELREGGRWDLDMVDDATGAHYPIRAVLRVVREPDYFEGVVSADEASVDNPWDVVLRVWFHDHGDKTRITLHQGPFAEENKKPTVDGWEDSFQKIDALIAGGAR